MQNEKEFSSLVYRVRSYWALHEIESAIKTNTQ